MTDLFITAPFVSHDAPDENGVRAEVFVQKGIGEIESIEDKGKTAKVSLKTPKMQYPVKGWINTDTEAYAIVKDAYQKHEPIEIRLEQRRLRKDKDTKEAIPRDTPIAELVKDPTTHKRSMDLVRRHAMTFLTGVAHPGGEMKFSQDCTYAGEDPVQGSARSAREMAENGQLPSSEPAGVQSASQSSYHCNGFESQPWRDKNPDGSANPGAYAIGSQVEFFFFLKDMTSNLRINPALTRQLASKLMGVCDYLQRGIYNNAENHSSRNISSYTRAKEIVKDVIKYDHPLDASVLEPDDGNLNDSLKTWLSDIIEESKKVYEWAYEEYSKSLGL